MTGLGIGIGVGLHPRGGKASGPTPPSFAVKGVSFGTPVYISRGQTLFNGVNSNFLFTTWLRTTNISNSPALWESVDGTNFGMDCYCYWQSNGLLNFRFNDQASSSSYLVVYNIGSAHDGNWHFIGFSCNLNMPAGAKVQSFTLDGVTVTPSSVNDVSPAFAVNWAIATDFSVGDFTGGGSTFNGDLSETYINMGSYRDMTNPTQVKNWYDAGQPADLGADGSNAGAGVPEGYLSVRAPSGTVSDYLANRGSGGSFTQNGGTLSLSAPPNP